MSGHVLGAGSEAAEGRPPHDHAARTAETLAKINEILLSALTVDDVIARLVGQASEAAGADKCLVIRVRDDEFTVTDVHNMDEDLVGRPKDASFFPGFALAARERRPILIENATEDPRTNKDFVVPYAMRAFQLLPLMVDDEVLGVLALAYNAPREFDAGDLSSAVRMTTAMSIALKNARLYEDVQRTGERLTNVMHSMSDGFVLLDRDWHYTLVNRRAAEMLGEPSSELVGTSLKDVYPDVAGWPEYERVMRERVPASFEAWSKPMKAWVEVHASPTPEGIAILFTDISERKASEEELAKTSDRLRLLADSARLLLATDAPEKVVQAIGEAVMGFLDSQAFFNYIVEDGGDALRLNAYAGIPKERAGALAHLDLGEAVCGCVARDGRRIVAEDIQHSSDERTRLVRSLGIQAYVCHPLVYQGKTIGTLSFGTTTRTRFTDDEIELMRVVSDQAATAMARRRAEDDLRASRAGLSHRTALLEGVNAILDKALRVETETELAEACLSVVQTVTGSPFGFIGEVDEHGTFSDLAISNPGWEACTVVGPGGHLRALTGLPITGLYGRVLRLGEAFCTNDPANHPDAIGTPEGHPPLTAFLGVPLISESRVFGMVAVANRPAGYGDEDERMLEALAPAIMEALQRKRAEQELAQATQRLDAHINNSPLAVIEFDSAFHISRWSREAEQMFGWSAPEVIGKAIDEIPWVYVEDVALVADESERLETGTGRSVNVNRNYRKDGSVIWCEWYDSAIYDAHGDMVSILSQVLDITERKNAEARLEAERERLRTIVDRLPLGVALFDAAGGVLEMNEASATLWGRVLPSAAGPEEYEAGVAFSPETGEPFSPEDWPVVKTMQSGESSVVVAEIVQPGGRRVTARITAVPLKNAAGEMDGILNMAEDISEETERRRLDEAIDRIRSAVGATLEVDEILHEVTARATDVLQVEIAITSVRKGGDWLVSEIHGSEAFAPGDLVSREDFSIVRTALAERRPVSEVDRGGKSKRVAEMRRLGARSIVVIPIVAQGRAMGAIALGRALQAAPFSELQMYFATRLVGIVSLALDNALAYERERTIADTLQEAVLAQPEPIEGVQVAYLYRPASAEANVGGDFYDLFELEGGKVAVVVGDVSGKGLDAARLTFTLRDGIRAYAYETLDPAVVLERVNRFVHRTSEVEAYATVFFALLDVRTGQLDYCSGGHPPSILARDGETRLLDAVASPVVGAFPGSRYANARTFLAADETLIAYTDGVTEARRGVDLFGEERLLEAVEAVADTPLPNLPDRILDRVLAFSGGKLSDDTVVMCVRLGDTTRG